MSVRKHAGVQFNAVPDAVVTLELRVLLNLFYGPGDVRYLGGTPLRPEFIQCQPGEFFGLGFRGEGVGKSAAVLVEIVLRSVRIGFVQRPDYGVRFAHEGKR